MILVNIIFRGKNEYKVDNLVKIEMIEQETQTLNL